jgi:cytochrome c oxidase subunit 2
VRAVMFRLANTRFVIIPALVALSQVPADGVAETPARPAHALHVVAKRYAFEPATLEVAAGEPVRLLVRSEDGTHGFAIPKLKIDVQIPKGGEPVVVEFLAPPPGRFEIACSEFCGNGHGQMKAALISRPVQTNH